MIGGKTENSTDYYIVGNPLAQNRVSVYDGVCTISAATSFSPFRMQEGSIEVLPLPFCSGC